jgi:hypothetical protein
MPVESDIIGENRHGGRSSFHLLKPFGARTSTYASTRTSTPLQFCFIRQIDHLSIRRVALVLCTQNNKAFIPSFHNADTENS